MEQIVFYRLNKRFFTKDKDGRRSGLRTGTSASGCNCKQGASGGVVLQFGFMACGSLYGPSYKKG
jgi:hypothetical protein